MVEVRPTVDQILSILIVGEKSLICEYCNKLFHNRSAKHFHITKTHRLESSKWQSIDSQLGIVGKGSQFFAKKYCKVNKINY